ncbi:DUF2071 domain-containing protein [Bacillus sp. V3-13]|uniref:YqjF family protein n=1 Tax=Bacillus sp. V3-13 TaxID=2053728 RepID=UPI000C756DA3|nr:DUF2071 domain-containing protein [Bacillus sp. V3-13]PLR78979.1 DUF2071 domain-containing protein [Bacillus sp. V3-13]
MDELKLTKHRLFPLPDRPWLMIQRWDHVFFYHWAIPSSLLKDHIPKQLELDEFDGVAWLGIVHFEVNKLKVRGIPRFPFLEGFLELNVRTYVKYRGKPGIYFFNLDASSPIVVFLAKTGYLLPYRKAELNSLKTEKGFKFRNKRIVSKEKTEKFSAIIQQTEALYYSQEGSLDHWLTERYCAWTSIGSKLCRVDIHHLKWRLSRAKAEIKANTMASFLPSWRFDTEPLVHYSPSKEAYFWPLKLEVH